VNNTIRQWGLPCSWENGPSRKGSKGSSKEKREPGESRGHAQTDEGKLYLGDGPTDTKGRGRETEGKKPILDDFGRTEGYGSCLSGVISGTRPKVNAASRVRSRCLGKGGPKDRQRNCPKFSPGRRGLTRKKFQIKTVSLRKQKSREGLLPIMKDRGGSEWKGGEREGAKETCRA